MPDEHKVHGLVQSPEYVSFNDMQFTESAKKQLIEEELSNSFTESPNTAK